MFTSAGFSKIIFTGNFSKVPNIRMGFVHVSDVVRAHINALEKESSNGERYIISEGDY